MTVTERVYQVLKDCPAARSDDYLLLERVLTDAAHEFNVDETDVYKAVSTLRLFPGIHAKTVFRDRADLQKKYPELANPKTVEKRKALEQEYREYYRANNERTENWKKVMNYDTDDLPEVEFDDPDQVKLF